MRIPFLSALIVATLCGIGHAQPHVNGYAGSTYQTVYFDDGRGNVTSLALGNGTGYGLVMDRTNTLLLVQNNDGFVYEVDPAAQAVVGTLAGVAAFGDIAVGQDGDYLISTIGGLYKLDATNKLNTVTTSLTRLFAGMDIDIDTGDLLVHTRVRGPGSLMRVARDGSTVVGLGTGAGGAYGIAQHIPTGDVYSSACCSGVALYVYRRGGSTAQVWLSSATPNLVYSLKADRASAVNQRLILGAQHSPMGQGGVFIADVGTKAVTRLSTINASFYETEILYRRNLHSNRTGRGQWTLGIRIPEDARLAYVLGVSASGIRPGITLSDGRTIQLVPDTFTIVGLGVGLAPYLTGTTGTLDASGRASAKLDLSSLGPAANGLILHFDVVTFAANAPNGIKTITDPHVIRVEGL